MKYTVIAKPVDEAWAVNVLELDYATQALEFDDIFFMAEDLIESITGEANPEMIIKVHDSSGLHELVGA
jgi:hypothetical protein